VAGAERAAVDDTRDERPHLAAGNCHHHFVQTRKARRGLLLPQEYPPLDVARDRDHIGVPEAFADCGGAGGELSGAVEVARAGLPAGVQAQQKAALGAFLPMLLEQTLDARFPAAPLGFPIAPIPDQEDAADGTGGGTNPVALLHVRLEGARARVGARLVESNQVGGGGEPIEILRIERRRAIGVGERGVRLGPGLPLEGSTAALEGCIHAS